VGRGRLRSLVARAAPRAGEHLVDIGCGTGNAALLAAEQGAIVTGVDPAERLLEVARAEAAGRGLDASFLAGGGESLPLADGSAQCVISCFGVIFAPDAAAAAAEMVRVAGGEDTRIAFTAWLPEGALAQVMRARSQALAHAGAAQGPPPFAWHDPAALSGLFAPLGFSVSVQEEALAFSAGSPEQFLDGELRDHPMWIAARATLEPDGELAALREQALAILAEANEEPGAFRITSRYVIVEARPSS